MTPDKVEAFRRQVQVVDLIGCEDTETLVGKVGELAREIVPVDPGAPVQVWRRYRLCCEDSWTLLTSPGSERSNRGSVSFVGYPPSLMIGRDSSMPHPRV